MPNGLKSSEKEILRKNIDKNARRKEERSGNVINIFKK